MFHKSGVTLQKGGRKVALIPTIAEIVARARADLRMGLPVILQSKGDLAIAIAAETLSEDRFAELRRLYDPVLAITMRRSNTLKARAYDGDLARVVIPNDANLRWIKSVADPAADLATPMKGPLKTLREGSADLHRTAIGLAKSARLLPAVLVSNVPSALEGLTLLDIDAVDRAGFAPLHQIISARVPLAASEAGRVHVFRPDDGGEEHYAIEVGQPRRDKPVLARLHSACFTGDVLGSLKCDCGPQLFGALKQMGAEGAGILLYLNQEGRGIGLANKMRAYFLQDQGFDTVEANHRLGFEDDERDFRLGADILKRMGFSSVRLLTNNPAKVEMMDASGIRVAERVPLKVGRNPWNTAYLDTKADKSGHLL